MIRMLQIIQIFSEKPPKAYPASEVFCTPSSPLWKFRHHPKRTLVFQAPKLPHALQANYVVRCGIITWVGWSIIPFSCPNRQSSVPFSHESPSIWGQDTEFPHRSSSRQVRGKASKWGFIHAFRGLKEQQFDTFCTLSEVRHLRCIWFNDIVFYWL